MKGKTKNPKLKPLSRLVTSLEITVSALLDFNEMNETAFDDKS